MKKGRPWYQFKSRIVEAFRMYNLSQAFGWTPNQIRSLEFEDYMMYISILKGIGQAKPQE